MDHPSPSVESARPARAEASARPDPEVLERALDSSLAISPGGLVTRRAERPELRLLCRDPERFVVATPFHEFSGDLRRGIVLQALRRPDGTLRPTFCHSGNIVEFRHRGRRLSLDVEDAIVDATILRLPGRVVLRHESRFVLPGGGFLGRRGEAVVRLTYEYAIVIDSPVLHVTVTLAPAEGVRLGRPRLTTALDNLSPSGRPGVRRVQAWAEAGPAGTLPVPPGRAATAEGLVLHAGPARHILFPEAVVGAEDEPDALACHLRLCDGARLISARGTLRAEEGQPEDGRLHWAVLRYAGPPVLTGPEPLVIREERLLTTAGERHDAPPEAAAMFAAARLLSSGGPAATAPQGRAAAPPPSPASLYREALHEGETLRRNVKVLASEMARARFAAGRYDDRATFPEAPLRIGIGSRVCRQADIESPWLRHWCRQLRMAPRYHRKIWEDCFIPQVLWEAGMLGEGRRALGFGVGREALPSLFAALGVEVLATDLDAADPRAGAWARTGQHGSRLESLRKTDLIASAPFRKLVSFRPVDMAAIPADLMTGGFDFVWSVCAMEHLGSLEAGERFVRQAMRCLKPGGIAVHTTEFNLDGDGETLAEGDTVFYQRRHLDRLAEELATDGHSMLPIEELGGEGGLFDRMVDLPPFVHQGGPKDAPHLRLALAGHTVTAVGLVIRAGAGSGGEA